jgi:uncharacterized protein (TIGR00369 family)
MTRPRIDFGGLAALERMISGELDHPAMLTLLRIRVVEAVCGRVVLTAIVDERFGNGEGVAHGGYAAALLDSALGFSANSAAAPGHGYATVALHIDLLHPLTTGAVLRCAGTVTHVDGRLATSAARITDEGGRLCAHGSATCVAIDIQ